MKRATWIPLALAVLFGSAAPARAQTLALDFTGAPTGTPQDLQTLGWEFNLTQTKTLTSLGIWDEGSNGLSENHLVAIWLPSGGAPLAQVLVTNANSTPVASTQPGGRWLFVDIAPLVLGPGNYVLGADYVTGADVVRTGAASLSLASGLTFVQGRFTNPPTPAFDFPNATFVTSGGHFGPNAQFADAAVVPEPASLALLGMATVTAGGYGAWRRRKPAPSA